MNKVDVIIPVYKPTPKLFTLLDGLKEQTLQINRILLVNTEESYFTAFTEGTDFEQRYSNVSVKHISKEEFDHGGTRAMAVSELDSPFFVMMTDDAVPADRFLLEKLLEPVFSGEAKMSYARQLPEKSSSILEHCAREFNYPDRALIKSGKDLQTMGIKAFFASNVCAAYDRRTYDELGGFVKRTIFNEDMIYARGLIDRGYCIAYAAEAKVYHSHNYNGIEQFKRYFDLGVSHAQYPAVFGGIKSESEGMRLVKITSGRLFKCGRPWLLIALIWQSGCKYLGYFLGKRYIHLPFPIIKLCSMNREYWKSDKKF